MFQYSTSQLSPPKCSNVFYAKINHPKATQKNKSFNQPVMPFTDTDTLIVKKCTQLNKSVLLRKRLLLDNDLNLL